MLPASHLISQGVPAGHRTSDGRCLRAFAVSPCSFCNNNKRFPQVKVVPSGNLTCASRGTTSFICNANSSGQRRNPDFSRQNRQGYSRNKNRNHEDRDAIDGFEDPEVFSSKNGQSFLSSSPPKFQSTAAPGPRERNCGNIQKGPGPTKGTGCTKGREKGRRFARTQQTERDRRFSFET